MSISTVQPNAAAVCAANGTCERAGLAHAAQRNYRGCNVFQSLQQGCANIRCEVPYGAFQCGCVWNDVCCRACLDAAHRQHASRMCGDAAKQVHKPFPRSNAAEHHSVNNQ